MNHPPDIDCLLSSQTRDDAKIVETMVAAFRPACYSLACALLGDADEAEDAIQQAFLSAALHIDRYKVGTDFKAWIYTITINSCRGMLRKRKVRQALERVLRLAQPQSVHARSLEAELVQKEAGTLLWTAVRGLDEKYRLVVILRYCQGLTIPEIAHILSIGEKTAYTRLYQAFRLLRSRLAVEMEDDWQDRSPCQETAP